MTPENQSDTMPDEIHAGMMNNGATAWASSPFTPGLYGEVWAKGMAPIRYMKADKAQAEPVFYSENADNLEGLEKAALGVLSNLMIRTNATSAEFMIGNDKDGEFHFTCHRGAQAEPVLAKVREHAAAFEAVIRRSKVCINPADPSQPYFQVSELMPQSLTQAIMGALEAQPAPVAAEAVPHLDEALSNKHDANPAYFVLLYGESREDVIRKAAIRCAAMQTAAKECDHV